MSFSKDVPKQENERKESLAARLNETKIEHEKNDIHPIVTKRILDGIRKSSKPVIKTLKGKVDGNDVTIKVYQSKEYSRPITDYRKFESIETVIEVSPLEFTIKLNNRLLNFFEKNSPSYEHKGNVYKVRMVQVRDGYLFEERKQYKNRRESRGFDFVLLSLKEPEHLTFYLIDRLYDENSLATKRMKAIDIILEEGLGLHIKYD